MAVQDPPTEVSVPGAAAARKATSAGGFAEVAAAFSKLGCLSFGGPVAHLGYVRAEIVEKRKWIDDAHYADLVALCQFLPGPASSQLVLRSACSALAFWAPCSRRSASRFPLPH